MSRPSKAARIVDVIVLILLGLGLYWMAQHRYQISDWWALRTYQPSEQTIALADAAGLSQYGRQLLYRGDPKLVDRGSLDQFCGPDLIGCISREGQIYILQDHEGKYSNEIITTAAHEMLHLAYRRLSTKERQQVDQMTADYLNTVNDPKLNELTNSPDHAEAADELHSVLGTTRAELPSELEAHYSRYFADRQKTIHAYRQSL
jgi:hypothetical protein